MAKEHPCNPQVMFSMSFHAMPSFDCYSNKVCRYKQTPRWMRFTQNYEKFIIVGFSRPSWIKFRCCCSFRREIGLINKNLFITIKNLASHYMFRAFSWVIKFMRNQKMFFLLRFNSLGCCTIIEFFCNPWSKMISFMKVRDSDSFNVARLWDSIHVIHHS